MLKIKNLVYVIYLYLIVFVILMLKLDGSNLNGFSDLLFLFVYAIW